MHKLLAILLILPSLGFSSNTILETSNLNLGGFLNHSYFFEEANKEQSYSLYIPNSYDNSKSYPLIILLHGLRSNPNQIINYQGIITEAENRGSLCQFFRTSENGFEIDLLSAKYVMRMKLSPFTHCYI